jgi:acyl carrier protein
MLDVPTRDISARVDAIVRIFVKVGAPNGVIGPDRNLEELGLTSMDMVNLMLAVEAEFDLTIPGSKLIPMNFRSIERVAALVEELTR